MARKPIQIDRDKLRAAVRKLGNKQVFYMLDDAIEPERASEWVEALERAAERAIKE